MFDMSSLLITTAKGGSNEHQSRWMRLKKKGSLPPRSYGEYAGARFHPGSHPEICALGRPPGDAAPAASGAVRSPASPVPVNISAESGTKGARRADCSCAPAVVTRQRGPCCWALPDAQSGHRRVRAAWVRGAGGLEAFVCRSTGRGPGVASGVGSARVCGEGGGGAGRPGPGPRGAQRGHERLRAAGSPHPELLLPHLPATLAEFAQPPAGAGDAADVRGRQRAAAQDVLQHFAGQVDEAAEARRLGHGLLRQRLHHLHRAVDRRRHLVRVPGAAARSRVRSGGNPISPRPPACLKGWGKGSPRPRLWPHPLCPCLWGGVRRTLKGKETRFWKITGRWASEP